jgi:hypothetical protein
MYNAGEEPTKLPAQAGPGMSVMNLTTEQQRAIQNGQAVRVTVAGADCVLVRKDVYERGDELDYGPWTADETNLLAAETADLLAGDGFDEPDAA